MLSGTAIVLIRNGTPVCVCLCASASRFHTSSPRLPVVLYLFPPEPPAFVVKQPRDDQNELFLFPFHGFHTPATKSPVGRIYHALAFEAVLLLGGVSLKTGFLV